MFVFSLCFVLYSFKLPAGHGYMTDYIELSFGSSLKVLIRNSVSVRSNCGPMVRPCINNLKFWHQLAVWQQ